MGTSQPVPQANTPQEQKKKVVLPNWIRPVIIALALVFFAGFGFFWISNIWGNTSDVMAALFAIIGAVCTFLALPFLYTSREAASSQITTIPTNPPVIINIGTGMPFTPAGTSEHTTVAPEKEPIPTTPPITPAATGTSSTVDRQISLPVEQIFLFNEKLADAKDFFGRSAERKNLLDRTKSGNSTSLIGARRIGKTWLLRYVTLVAPLQLGPDYHVGYFDASLPKCGTIAGFTSHALEALGYPVLDHEDSLKLVMLETVVKKLIELGKTPVLCIDEFERLSDGQEFDLEFFAGLRAITQTGMCMITASQKPLIEMVSEHVKTSPFFNVFEQISLMPFKEYTAKKFVEEKSKQAGFTGEESGYLLEYGKVSEQEWSPLRLQLVGKMLLTDKINAQEDPDSYRPTQHSYWRDFEKRLDSTYQAVVGS